MKKIDPRGLSAPALELYTCICPPFSKIFFSKTAWPVKAKFYVESPWEGGNKVQFNLSNPACYQNEKKIRIRQGTGIDRLTNPRDIKVTLVSIGIQHTVDNGYVNELYTQIYSRLKFLLL